MENATIDIQQGAPLWLSPLLMEKTGGAAVSARKGVVESR